MGRRPAICAPNRRGCYTAAMGKMMVWLIVGLMICCGPVARAGPFEDVTAAYQRGDYATVLKLLHPLADRGNAVAQFDLGAMYAIGKGVPQDFREALKWYRLAADQGDALGQNKLGSMYQEGQGVARDYNEATKWYRRAANQGNSIAQFNLGVMYRNGAGVAQDYVRSYMWFLLAESSLIGKAVKKSTTPANNIVGKMTQAEIGQAEDMARKCQQSSFRDCE